MEDKEEDREKAASHSPCRLREGPAHLLLFLTESHTGKTPSGTWDRGIGMFTHLAS